MLVSKFTSLAQRSLTPSHRWIYRALLAHIAKMKAESGAFLEDGEGGVGHGQGTGESDTLLLHFSDEEEEGFAQVAEAEDEGEVLALVR